MKSYDIQEFLSDSGQIDHDFYNSMTSDEGLDPIQERLEQILDTVPKAKVRSIRIHQIKGTNIKTKERNYPLNNKIAPVNYRQKYFDSSSKHKM